MVTSCCAFNCSRRAAKNLNDEHVTFHGFPKNKQLLKKWIAAVRRKDWNPTKHSRLCSFHFTPDSYDTSGWSSVPKLKSDAVPTIFDFPAHLMETVVPRPPPRERNPLPSQSEVIVPSNSPLIQNVNVLYVMPDDPLETGGEVKTNELPQFDPEVIVEQPSIKRTRKCYLGDFKDDVPNLSPDDAKSFTAIARSLLDKKNKQIKLLRQKNRRLEKRISNLETVLENLITSRVS